MSSARYVPLSTDHLAANPSGEVTMQTLLEDSERLAEEARDIMPYDFGECSYSKGYLRQAVWSCLDCGEKGVCYGCSISCHADHKLVELFVRRQFRCDCPTLPAPSSTSERACKLNPPALQPAPPNEENKYDSNFRNEFCRCGRAYDPETEAEAMLQCMGCEDWFHESCLNLLAGPPPPTPARPAGTDAETADAEEDDDESPVMIRSDTYDCLVCAACVRSHPLLSARAGTEGWMMIEPDEQGVWGVVGRPGAPAPAESGLKRAAEDEPNGDDEKKRVKLDGDAADDGTHTQDQPQTPVDGDALAKKEETAAPDAVWRWKGKGDVFLADGVRDQLKSELDAKTAASLPFPLEDQEIYEPPKDVDREETFDEVSNRVINGLPRAQTIEALHGYQNMKDKLQGLFAAHIESGTVVSKEAIESLFEQLKEAKR